MARAILLSKESVECGGGPFGAVIARNGEIVAEASNRVTIDCDPTAHAEVSAIRKASKVLGTFNLSGCEIFTSCEPCPMCLGAIYWAHIGVVYYAGSSDDAKNAGFDDSFIYKELNLEPKYRSVKMLQADSQEGFRVFKKWVDKDDRVEY